MKLYRIMAIARKEAVQILRDWRSLAMGIAIPFALLLLFGFALSLDVDNVPMAVWDQSQTPESRDLISRFSGSPYFKIKGQLNGYKEIENAIDRRNILAALIIPVDFASKLNQHIPLPIQFIIDGSDSNTATIALGYANGIVTRYSNEIVMEQLMKVGKQEPPQPIDVRSRVWFNPDLESTYTIVPGLVAVIMMVISAMLTSLTIAREWERGTMEQLISTPVKVSELITGKMIPYFVIGMVDTIIVVVAGVTVFDVPIKGSALLLFVMSTIFMIGTLSLGILISIRARNQLLASQLAMVLTFLPSFLLSGFFTSLSNLPIVIQWISYLVPARYFMVLIKGIYLKGLGLRQLYFEALLLCIYSIVMILLARFAFKKKLESS